MDKKAMKKALKLPAIIALLATLLMVICVFLPYATVTEEKAEWCDTYPDYVVYEELNMTAKDIKNVSIFDFTRIYYTLCEQLWHDSFYGIFYVAIMGLILGFALIAALFALGRKPIGVMIFAGASMGVFHVQNLDYTMRGVIPGSNYDWGMAHYLFPVAATVAVAAAIWMLVMKIRFKKALKAQAVETVIPEA